ncbi:uncharacterized protein LOC129983935 [Argiope bruennichi]|uniref:uncharacterized protein LOC129983935 n=1 Tax=Argiope bruennichi TaxID=94029 RepID=UPI0024959C0F|nr:uncharacterized protein LOC129983935 [Argiope bruennichi]
MIQENRSLWGIFRIVHSPVNAEVNLSRTNPFPLWNNSERDVAAANQRAIKRFSCVVIRGILDVYKAEGKENQEPQISVEKIGIVVTVLPSGKDMEIQILLLIAVLPCCLAELLRLESALDEGPPQPYTFGYEVHNHHGDQWRSEVSDGFGHVHGSYGFVDNDGMHREVQYIADDGGFRAKIKTNEPGMDMPNPADVVMVATPPSDYDAAVYGLERVHPIPMRSNRVETQRKTFHRQRKFSPRVPPPIYVRNGNLQSPWFPMHTVANV